MEEPVIFIQGLCKCFSIPWKRSSVVALDHLDLKIRRGEIFGLLGPNGSGKSTTLKLILGLLDPTAGKLSLFEQSPKDPESKRRIGFLPENPYFHRFLTGIETLRFYGKLCSLRTNELNQRIPELLALVDLESAGDRSIGTYSKGMLQRIGLAQALIHDPDLLILDEPTAAVDPIGARQIRDILIRLRTMGKTILFSSHLLDQVEEISDRVAILHQGRKLVEGRLQDLLQLPDRIRWEATGLTPDQARQAAETLRAMGGHNVQQSAASLSLEKLFMDSITHAGDRS